MFNITLLAFGYMYISGLLNLQFGDSTLAILWARSLDTMPDLHDSLFYKIVLPFFKPPGTTLCNCSTWDWDTGRDDRCA